MVLHVTCSTDNNYIQHCVAMLCSLFSNNELSTFCVHMLTNNLSSGNRELIENLCIRYKNKIVFYAVDEALLEGLQYRKYRPLTKAAYYRILLPSIIDKDVEKILYLDCDMIVLGDVRELFEINLDGYALAATRDASPYNEVHRRQLNFSLRDIAFCSGIMMINLRYWREYDAEAKLMSFSRQKRNPVFLHDQDAMNYVFRNQWFEIAPKWNRTPLSVSPMSNREFDNIQYGFYPKIIHYSSDLKPWLDVWFPEKKYYIKYLMQSGYTYTKYKKTDASFKIRAYLKVFRYGISKNIMPFIPKIFNVLVSDIVCIITSLCLIVCGSKRLSIYRFHMWEERQK